MQLALVRKLDADLADVVRSFVVRGLVALIDALEVVIIDASDVADDVRCDLAERILPEQARLDLDARKAIAIDGEARDFLVGEPRAQGHRFEVLRFVEQLPESLAIARRDLDQRRQLLDRIVEILDLRGRDFERVRGEALREHDAVAIGDHAPIRHCGHQRDPIALGERRIVALHHDLQEHEAAEQRNECEHDNDTRQRQPAAEEVELAFRVFEFGHGCSGSGPPLSMEV